MTRSTLRQLREEEYGARHQPRDAQYVHHFVHDPEMTRRIQTSSKFDDAVGTQPWTMREEFEQKPWQYFATASVGVKQKGMMYYTEQDVKDSRFADPDLDRDDDGDTRSREGFIPKVSTRTSYRQPNEIDFSSLGIRDDNSSKKKDWRALSSDSQEQESSGIARLKAMTGTRANNKSNAFVTPNATHSGYTSCSS
jgi:hypothetical protein